MKKAKTRTPPILTQLVSSTRHANRAIRSAVTYVAKSNRRLTKNKPGSLAQLLAEMPEGLPINRDWDNLLPVGLEVVGHAQPTAVADIPPDDLEVQMSDKVLESVNKLRGIVRKPARPVSIAAMHDAIAAKVVADADTANATEAARSLSGIRTASSSGKQS